MSKETHPQIEEKKYSSPAEEYIFFVQITIFFASDKPYENKFVQTCSNSLQVTIIQNNVSKKTIIQNKLGFVPITCKKGSRMFPPAQTRKRWKNVNCEMFPCQQGALYNDFFQK